MKRLMLLVSLLALALALPQAGCVPSVNSGDDDDSVDPWVLLEMVRQGLENGEDKVVASRLDQMARQANKSARLLYERAALLGERDPERSKEIWKRYLDQDPTGVRSEEIRSMGL